MYILHIANKNYSSWSLRPWVLMTQLEIPFEEKLSVFVDGSNWKSFRSFSPTGLVPCLEDGDAVIWDSLAIAEYLAEKHSDVWPQSTAARAWARCAAAEMHSGFSSLRNQCSMTCGQRIRLNQINTDLQKDVDRLAELWQQGLNKFGGPFLAGQKFTAVDAFYTPVAFRIQTYGLPLPELASAYAGRLLELPAMQSWYTAALAEPWREANHEIESLSFGRQTVDYRAAPAAENL